MPTTLGKTMPPGWTSPDQPTEPTDAARRRAQKTQLMRRRRAELTPSNQDLDKAQNTQSRRRRRAELSPEDAQRRKAMDTLWRRRLNSARAAGRGRVLESMSWSGCCNSACVQCLGLTGACAACSHCTATAWELSDLDHSHAATPQRVTRASCAQLLLLRSDFCAWRRLLLICWKLLIGVVYETGLLLLFAYIALLLLPLSFVLGVGAPSLSLVGFIFVIEAVRRGSLSFSWLGSLLLRRLVCTRQACCLFAHVALLRCFRRASSSGFARRRFPSVSSGS